MKKLPFHDVEERAKAGDAFSQVLLGFLFEHGLHTSAEKKTAEKFYRLAASQEFAPGLYALAFLISDAEPAECLETFRRAAEMGYAPAQFVLGYLHQDGELTQPDSETAIAWIEAAAAQDYTPAIAHLGNMYAASISVIKDIDKAMYYWKRAATNGDPHSASMLEREKELRDLEAGI